MEYRNLGHSGLKVSQVILGSWLTYGFAVPDDEAFRCLHKALEMGVNCIDTADVYNRGGAELVIGRFLKTEVVRSQVVIATKAFFPMSDHWMDRGLSARHLMNACEASLLRLQTEYIDLYQCHRYDYDTPLEETCFAMHNLIARGYVRHWGVSQWTATQIVDALHVCERNGWQKPIANQPIYNLINRSLEAEVMETCETRGVGLITFSPLAQGLLTGKYTSVDQLPPDSRAAHSDTASWFNFKRMTEENLAKVARMKPIAQRLDCTLAQLALAWCLYRRPVTSVIIGASRVAQVVDNVNAVNVRLTPDIVQEIEAVWGNAPRDQYTGHEYGYGRPKLM